MGFLTRSKDKKDTSSQLSHHSTQTTGPAIAHSSKAGSGTYAAKGGRASAASRDGNAWSMSVAYGGESSDNRKQRNPDQVSTRHHHTYTSGNAVAGVFKGGTFAAAGPGGYGEAAYREGSRFGVSVAYGGEKEEEKKMKGGAIQFRHGDLVPLRKSSNHGGSGGRIESYDYPSSGDESEHSDG